MTAVVNPHSFPQLSRPAWGSIDGDNSGFSDDLREAAPPRKNLSRSNSSSSTGSDSSNTTVATNGSVSNGTSISANSDSGPWSANTAQRKRPPQKAPWPGSKNEIQPDFYRLAVQRPNGMGSQGPMQLGPAQSQIAPQQMMRPPGPEQFSPGQPVLFLLSLNGTFERKTIAVPFAPDNLRIGRQTNQKTVPTPTNGFFDSKVLSRQHAEIYAERNGKIYIRDVKSSNGTFVNGTRLSQENRESEPHELQTADHLELGIDIVSEDQKTVVHHKVAAKVEHAGFMGSPKNVMDINFGDLDPANSSMTMPGGALQFRGRQGSNASMGSNGRMPQNGMMSNGQGNGMQQQRPFFLTPVATDQILKRLTNEMRSARLHGQDLNRTNSFVNSLLSKDDIKDMDKRDVAEPSKPQHNVHSNGASFGKATRFSDPPAPPPQAPLPEKPDVPSLRRGPTERPKSGPPNTSPIRQDNLSQVIQLTEALNNAKRDFDSQSARMRELETMLHKERTARELAESLAKQLGESSHPRINGTLEVPSLADSVSHAPGAEATAEGKEIPSSSTATTDVANVTGLALQSRIDTMDNQMQEMRQHMEQWRQRCELAESERDADRKTLAEMVNQLRAEEARRIALETSRSRSRKRQESRNEGSPRGGASVRTPGVAGESEQPLLDDQDNGSELGDDPTLSRANTITPLNSRKNSSYQGHHLQAGLPYASMVGVVLMGMGLMAYLNGWQAPPPRVDQ